MQPSRGQLRAKLMSRMESYVEEVLDWCAEEAAPTLSQMEDKVLDMRQRLGHDLASTVMQAQAAREPVPGPVCTECGQEMHNKGQKAEKLRTRLGELAVERHHYYCSRCRRGFFPPGPAVVRSQRCEQRGAGGLGGVVERAGEL